ncbi:MAG TPA: DUF5685 family protein [Anaerovoracaceae bacterium]|nr:DUF5685 family protein [Anaerovoracaceae bacterium]
MLFFRKETMLGYIKPDKPELKIKEFEIYSGYYCGICKSISARYGQLPRLVLNYDSVFLAILIAGIHSGAEHIEIERCIVHPAKKRTIIYDSSEIDYAADILLLLAYYKLKDDYQDERSIKAAIGAALMKGTFHRLMITAPEKCDYVRDQLSELSRLESEKCPSIDRSAEPFAKLMEEVFDYPGWKKEKNSDELPQIFRRIGYHLGKWIYLIDAYDDIEENLKKHSFNPLIIQFEFDLQKETVDEFKERIRERVERNLVLYLAEIAKSCSHLKFEKNQGLIENILYFGLMRKTEEILRTKGIENNAESI